jgi:hypothetical protein
MIVLVKGSYLELRRLSLWGKGAGAAGGVWEVLGSKAVYRADADRDLRLDAGRSPWIATGEHDPKDQKIHDEDRR